MERLSSIVIERKPLLTALRLVKHAVAREKSRPALSGINIHSKEDGTIDIFGADGFRLAMYNLPAIIKGEFVSVFPLSLLSKVKGMKEEKITIIVASQKRARINGEEIEVISDQRLNYLKLIPVEFAHKATFFNTDLKAFLEEVKTIAKEASGIVRLETTERNIMRLWVSSYDNEIKAKEIPANIGGLPGRIAIDWKYLRDALNTGAHTIKFNSPSDICVFTGAMGLIEVMMPRFVEW